MIYQIAAVLSTYVTRRWLMLGFGLGAIILAFGLTAVSLSPMRTLEPMLVMQLVALPTMIMLSFLVQHAKWQFVHSRARLVPRYAEVHLLVLFTLLMVTLVAYPLVTCRLLDISLLGIMAFVLLLAGTVAWAIHTMRPLFVLGYLALFFSFLVPSVSPVWIAHDPRYDGLRWGCLLVGCVAVGLWLRRLPRMTEESEDFVVPVQGNFGSSRMEKSEARRVMVLALSRARLQGWFADRWHDRLSRLTPPDESGRTYLLRYGFAPVSAPVRAVFFIALAVTIGLVQSLAFSSLPLSNPNRNVAASKYGAIATMGMLAFMAPILVSQLLATRMPRLGQELLLPMSRATLINGLARTLAREMATLAALGATLVIAGALVLRPELVTPTNVAATLMAIAAIQPLLFGICLAAALIRSTIARLLLIVMLLYVVLGCGAGIFALGRFVSLAGAAVVAAVLIFAGLGLTRVARGMWMRAELGR